MNRAAHPEPSAGTLEPDRWLSGLMGVPAYTLKLDGALAASGRAEVRRLQGEGAFLQAKVAADDPEAVESLEALGFRLVDTNVVLEGRPVVDGPATAAAGVGVRFAGMDDRAGVVALAATAFEHSRFHRDRHLPAGLADRIKAAWAGAFFAGTRGDRMVVADAPGGGCAGFLQLIDQPEGTLLIDLVAVAPALRGRGTARAMIAFACRNSPGIGAVRVGTQLANRASLRLYQGLGLALADARYVFHSYTR